MRLPNKQILVYLLNIISIIAIILVVTKMAEFFKSLRCWSLDIRKSEIL